MAEKAVNNGQNNEVPCGIRQRLDYNADFRLDWHDPDEATDGYQLKWIGKDYARLQSGTAPETVIIPDKKHNAEPQNKDSQNIFITGDNLQALKHLQNAYYGSVDMIYIDPPYNTGSDGFVYNDKFEFTDEQLQDNLGLTEEQIKRLKVINGRSSHSAWLTFMYPRLRIARTLLKDTGVIFISIDDNEQANLKLLCDEIFGEENLIDILMVEMSNTGGMKVGAAKTGTIAKNGEYVLLYAKTQKYIETERTALFDFVPGFDTHFNLFLAEDGKIVKFDEILSENTDIVKEFEKLKITKGQISISKFEEFFEKSEVLQNFVLNNLQKIVRPRTEIPNIPNEVSPQTGSWLKYNSSKRNDPYFLTKKENGEIIQLVPILYNYRQTDDFKSIYGRSVIRGDYWKGFYVDMGNVSKEGDVDFKNGKKPVRLIRQLAKWAVSSNKSALIMDFFAGSATTAHAVMQFNKEDGGKRRYIMVQLDEPTWELDKNGNQTAKKHNEKVFKAGFMSIDQIGRQRIKNAAKQIGDSTGFKHFYVNSPNTVALNKITEFNPDNPNADKLFSEDIVQELGGTDVILQTWMAADGYMLTDIPQEIDIAGYKAYYCGNSVLYLIENGWQQANTKALLNLIGGNKINVNTIICCAYSFTFESMSELETNIRQSLSEISVEKRY